MYQRKLFPRLRFGFRLSQARNFKAGRPGRQLSAQRAQTSNIE